MSSLPTDTQQPMPARRLSRPTEAAQPRPPQYTEAYAPTAAAGTPKQPSVTTSNHITESPAPSNPFADATTNTSTPRQNDQPDSTDDKTDAEDPDHERDIPDTASLAYPHSLLPAYSRGASYKGRYKSEEDYLNALRAWAKEKEYMQPVDRHGNSITLHGFYGDKTSDDYIREAEERKSVKMRGSSSESPWRRKKSVAAPTEGRIEEDGSGSGTEMATPSREGNAVGVGPGAGSPAPPKMGRRRSSLADWLKGRRKSSVAVEQA